MDHMQHCMVVMLRSVKIVSSLSFVTPERLPPSEYVTKLHCRRTRFQIMIWIEQQDGIDAVKWGWNVENDQLIPIMSQMTTAVVCGPVKYN